MKKIAIILIVVSFLVTFVDSPEALAHGRDKTPAEFSVITGNSKSILFTDAELKKMAKPFKERRDSFQDQVYVSLQELFETVPHAQDDTVIFEDYHRKNIIFKIREATQGEKHLAIVSTNHGGWKLISLTDAKKQTGPGSFYLRSIKTVTIRSDESSTAKGKGEQKIYTDVNLALKESDQVFILNLAGQNLKTLPAEITKFKNLRELYLGRNHFSVLPPAIGELQNLQMLNLGRNSLTSLPSEIGNLKKLAVLKLGRNQIDKLPKEIVKLENLENLDLDNNQLQEIPGFLAEMKKLEDLGLASNRIQRVPAELRKISTLERLDLEGNPLLAGQKKDVSKNLSKVEVLF